MGEKSVQRWALVLGASVLAVLLRNALVAAYRNAGLELAADAI